ncbi:ImmA/IrrE family metallo-endopeptidase (plasmid) [Komagataeibacter nataicola]|uniref:ImmA/IrrE family metallo-endopeptidase n=1 Tax=Komagataeibacter nataicola TaxID=265960 RepID=UPI0023DD2086|nr:ImmA/IrrE family metallo-endopeptidase [Komagataeibacter nataicola]WEQ54214.1 ImmA/IrrE family metallo-endopeptidase [Komagataeibacter nataicola]
MAQVAISPDVLEWARKRAGMPFETLSKRFKKYPFWLDRQGGPTFQQLETLASVLHLPVGMFFLPEPPKENLPLPDFRRMADGGPQRPSTELIDTIHICQRRQRWYREYVAGSGATPLTFVGCADVGDQPAVVAGQIRTVLKLEVGSRNEAATWEEFLRQFIAFTREAGVLVMINGVVGNNTHRPLNPREFRGFAITDSFAPLVFVNGADTKSGQIFTLAHELAHIWVGKDGVSNSAADDLPEQLGPDSTVERFCNAVAAEVLVPMAQLSNMELPTDVDQAKAMIARTFRTSTLVALRRMKDLGRLSYDDFQDAYDAELDFLKRKVKQKKSSGGDFYNTMGARVDPHFASAVISAALEGQTLMGDAFELLNIKNSATFRREARHLGVIS